MDIDTGPLSSRYRRAEQGVREPSTRSFPLLSVLRTRRCRRPPDQWLPGARRDSSTWEGYRGLGLRVSGLEVGRFMGLLEVGSLGVCVYIYIYTHMYMYTEVALLLTQTKLLAINPAALFRLQDIAALVLRVRERVGAGSTVNFPPPYKPYLMLHGKVQAGLEAISKVTVLWPQLRLLYPLLRTTHEPSGTSPLISHTPNPIKVGTGVHTPRDTS